MYYYRIGYSGWEESDNFVLAHDHKFTSDRLKYMIAECVYLIIKKCREKDPNAYFSRIEDVFRAVDNDITLCVMLCTQFGFKRLEYMLDVDMTNNSSMFDCLDDDNADVYLKAICTRLRLGGFKEDDDSFSDKNRNARKIK